MMEEMEAVGFELDIQDAQAINQVADAIHRLNEKWWCNPATGEPIERNFGEMIALMTSELSEALEAHRKNLMDDKLPHRHGVEVELADAVIRIFDTAAGLGYDIGTAIVEKCYYNANREDHKLEHRMTEHGKKY